MIPVPTRLLRPSAPVRAPLVLPMLLLALAVTAPAPAAQMASDENREALANGLAALLGDRLEQVDALVAETTGQAPAAAPAGAPAAAAPVPRAHASGGIENAGFTLNANQRLEFHARALNVADAFAQLRQMVRMNIVVSPEVSARFTGDLYDLTADQVIEAICRSANLLARREASFVYIEPDRPETRIYQLDHARAEDLVDVIQPLLSEVGRVMATVAAQQGIVSTPDRSGGDDYAASDTLVVRDYTRHLQAVDDVIRSIDAQPRQVLVEATILTAELNDRFALGVEFFGLLGVDFEDGGVTSPDTRSLTFDPMGFDGGELDGGAGNVSTNLIGNLPNTGLSVGLLKDGVGVFLKALEQVTDTTVLANPKIITLNKQRGEVLLGRRDGFITTTVTQTSTTQSVEFLETGTRLIYRPFITNTGLVRLEIHPEDSDGGVNAEGLPFKETAEVTTNVMVPDGETVVIGGLFRERDKTTRRKVPLLGSLPLIGGLFRSEDTESVREEIVILLTPHILGPDGRPTGRGARDGGPRRRPDDERAEPAAAVAPVTAAHGAAPAAQGFDDVFGLAAAPVAGADFRPALSRPVASVTPAPEPAALTAAYLAEARDLLAEGRYASAGVMLDSLPPEQRRAAEVRRLRDQVWRGLIGDVSRASVDDAILSRILGGNLR